MPISLSRRTFLAGVGAAAGMAYLGCTAKPKRDVAYLAGLRDPNRLALFSDTHINADAGMVEKNVNMAGNLRGCVEEVLAMDAEMGAPSAVLVNGDCAHKSGEPGDYARFVSLMSPLVEAGLPVHLGLGNHDHRERFWEAVTGPEFANRNRVVALKNFQVLRLYTPQADVLMLDSLEKTMQTPGALGTEQLGWLKSVLDDRERGHRSVVVFVHHNPPLPAVATSSAPATSTATGPASQPKFIGLSDGQELLDLLIPRKQVKAVFYGHTHQWKRTVIDGLHIVNLPATSYVFGNEPTGWTDCRISATGMKIELKCVDKKDARHGERFELAWRG